MDTSDEAKTETCHMTRAAIHSADAFPPGPTPGDGSSPSILALDLLLKRALVELPPECRLAFMLSRFDGLAHPQVAAKMGISVKRVEKHISHALLAFRAAVREPGG